MKSYTDLEQSKKLAEILPLESADMVYCYTKKGDKLVSSIPIYLTSTPTNTFKYLYCWSLAVLFDVLPNFIGDYGKCLYYDVGGYYCGYMIDGDFMLTIEETKADNPVDACYEMIIKLNEQKLL